MRAVLRPFSIAVLVLTLSTTGWVRAQAPDVVNQVGDNAVLFVAVPSLKGLSDEIASINQRLGINEPRMGNVLGMVKAMSGLNAGLNDEGGAALVLTRVPDPEVGEPDMYVLVPTNDYAGLLANFGVTEANPDSVTMVEVQGSPSYVKKSGDYAVVANSEAVCAAYARPAGNRFAARAGRLSGPILSGSDILLYMDIEKWAPLVQQNMAPMLMQAQMQLEMADPATAEMGKAFLKLYAEAIQAFFRDGQGLLVGIDADSAGIGLALSAHFKEDSPVVQALGNPPTAPLTLNRLPDGPYILVSSMNLSNVPVKQWMEQLAAAFGEGNDFAKLMTMGVDAMANSTGDIQTGMYPAFGPLPFAQAVVYASSDPAKLREAGRAALGGIDGLSLMPGMTYKATVTPDAADVGGRKVDQFTIGMDMGDNLPPELAQNPFFSMMTNQTGYLATTEGTYVEFNGSDTALLERVLAAADGAGKAGDGPGIADVRAKLQPDRVGEAYFSIQGLITAIKPMVGMFMPQVNLDLPADLKPIGVSFSTGGGGAGYRLYVPMEVIESVANKVHEIQRQFTPPANGVSQN